MKILILIEQPGFNLNNRFSAVACVVQSFAKVLSEAGHSIRVNQKELVVWEKEKHGGMVGVGRMSSIIRFVPKRIREIIKDIKLFSALKNYEKQILTLDKPDIIIGWISYGSSVAATCSKKWNVPLIAIYDNPIAEEYKFLFGYYPFFKARIERHERNVVKQASVIIAYSKEVENYVLERYHPKAKFYYIAFTDFKRMDYVSQERVTEVIRFAYIGSFFNWHNTNELIDVFGDLCDKGYNCELIMIGDGIEKLANEKLVNSKRLNAKVKFTGRLDADFLANQISLIHVGIIPNALFWQGPVKLFQYAAAGMPVIAKNTPSIASLTKSNKGFILFDDKKGMQDAMEYLLLHTEKIHELGKEAQQFVRSNYSENNYLDLFNTIFKELKLQNA